MSITAGQLVSAFEAFDTAVSGISASELDLSSLSSDAVLGEDILSIVAVFWPPAALIEDALVVAVALAPLIAASGITIKPDPNPMQDAQTTQTPHSGRNG